MLRACPNFLEQKIYRHTGIAAKSVIECVFALRNGARAAVGVVPKKAKMVAAFRMSSVRTAIQQNFTSGPATFLPVHRLSNTVNAGTYHEDCYPNCD